MFVSRRAAGSWWHTESLANWSLFCRWSKPGGFLDQRVHIPQCEVNGPNHDGNLRDRNPEYSLHCYLDP